MTINELIKKLQELPPDAEIMILDGGNGCGYPRTLNFGPVSQKITDEDVQAVADCEDTMPGVTVYVIGYGCY